MAYSEELSMFTVHHYSAVPVYTCMCIYPDCDKIAVSVLVFLGEALLLCPGSARTG